MMVKEAPLFKDKIVPLLNHLSYDRDKEHGLGDVEVISALRADDPRCTDLDTQTLQVFLGDLHLPVVTKEAHTYFAESDDEPPPDEVLSCGRLSLNDDVKAIVDAMALEAGITLAAAGMTLVVPSPAPLALAGLSLKGLAMLLWAREALHLPKGLESDGVMGRHEAKQWFTAYHGTQAKKGADIFQNAADDLVKFVLRLRERPSALGKVKLAQLGDLNDFWIGMKCGFDVHASQNDGAHYFVDFWRNRVKNDPHVGKVESLLEGLHQDYNLPTTLLYGNHDNYFHGQRPASCYDKGNTFWAEHGHQSDPYNCDEDARRGWALTQTAFLRPEVRDLEDPVSATICAIKRALHQNDAYPSRLDQIARGVDACLENRKLIYVMGHTHRACLRRVTLKTAWDQKEVDQDAYQRALREAEDAMVQLGDMAILKKLAETADPAVDAAALAAARQLAQIAKRLIQARRKYLRAKRQADAQAMAMALAAERSIENEFVQHIILAAKAKVVFNKADTAVRIALRIALEAIAAQLEQEAVSDEATAKMIIDAAQKAAKAAWHAYLRLLDLEHEAAERAAKTAQKELRDAARWLEDLSAAVKNELETKAKKFYQDCENYFKRSGH
jgi:UDP-2,3-diacylglucosamine pyrophosphatase LpxH